MLIWLFVKSFSIAILSYIHEICICTMYMMYNTSFPFRLLLFCFCFFLPFQKIHMEITLKSISIIHNLSWVFIQRKLRHNNREAKKKQIEQQQQRSKSLCNFIALSFSVKNRVVCFLTMRLCLCVRMSSCCFWLLMFRFVWLGLVWFCLVTCDDYFFPFFRFVEKSQRENFMHIIYTVAEIK